MSMVKYWHQGTYAVAIVQQLLGAPVTLLLLLQVLSEAAAKQAQLSAQAEAITHIMNQLVAGHAALQQTYQKQAVRAEDSAGACDIGSCCSSRSDNGNSSRRCKQHGQPGRYQAAAAPPVLPAPDAGHVSGSQVSTASFCNNSMNCLVIQHAQQHRAVPQ